MLWGHRNDPVNFHRCLQDFDRRLPDLLDALRPGDILILTSDHGCDPTTPSTDHSREHALLLSYVEGPQRRGPDSRRASSRMWAPRSTRGSVGRHRGASCQAYRSCDPPCRSDRAEARRRRLEPEELTELILGHASGEIPDYQLAAFCMAVYFRGMTTTETYAMTDAMVRSGATLDLHGELGRRVVDKHSTGGVGGQDLDPRRAGRRGLRRSLREDERTRPGSHRLGTLDKLESIPGFRVELRRRSSSPRFGTSDWRSSASHPTSCPRTSASMRFAT